MAFGAGVTTAVFSLVDTVLLKPLPFPDGDRLVTVYESSPSAREKTSLIAPGRLEDWQRLNRSFVALSGSYSDNVTDTSGAEPERLEGRRVAPRFFAVYGMPPLAGRWFTNEEEWENGPRAVMISDRLWARRFGGDRAAVGRPLVIGGRSYPIVGVMPGTFTSAATDVWLPAQTNAWLLRQRDARFMQGVGRLRPGVSLEAAGRELATLQAAFAREFPKTDAGWSAEIRSFKEGRIANSRRGLLLIFAAVASLWIIAVANIAGLTLVQLHRRARELAIRAALGASRARAIGTVMREAFLIAALGGALGAGLAAWLVSLMPALLSTTPRINELTLDWRALAFVGATSLLAACAFSLVSALAGSRPQLSRVISAGNRSVAGGQHRLQRLLVVCQVALSVLLVGSATLLLRSYYNLTQVDTGIDTSSTVTFHVGAAWSEDRWHVGQLQETLIARLEQLPHVQAAGLTNFLPATGATLRYQIYVDGLTGPNVDGSMTVGTRMISGGYLRAIRASLVAGEWCPAPKTDFKAPGTAIVNQRFVEVHAPNQNLVGRSLWMIRRTGTPFRIVAVVGNIAEDGQATSPVPYVYTCISTGSWPDPEYVARTTDSRAFAADLRRLVRELDPKRAVFGLRPRAGGPRRGARSAAARRRDARPLCRGRGHPGGDRPLQPLHAHGRGARAGDGRAARHWCRAAAARDAGHGRRRTPARGRHRGGHRADGRGRSPVAGRAVRRQPSRRARARRRGTDARNRLGHRRRRPRAQGRPHRADRCAQGGLKGTNDYRAGSSGCLRISPNAAGLASDECAPLNILTVNPRPCTHVARCIVVSLLAPRVTAPLGGALMRSA